MFCNMAALILLVKLSFAKFLLVMFFLTQDIYTTQGLRYRFSLFCDCYSSSLSLFSSTKGLKPPFTEAPSNQTYFEVGQNVTLKWSFPIDAKFKRVEMEHEKSGSLELLVWKTKDGTVSTNPNLPKILTSRVTIKGSATLVISAATTGDANKYVCSYFSQSGDKITEEPVELIATGIVPVKNVNHRMRLDLYSKTYIRWISEPQRFPLLKFGILVAFF